MNLDSLTTPSEETVAEYVSVFQNIDWRTGLKGILILVIGLLAVKLVMRLVTRALQRSHIPASLHTMIRTLLRILLDVVVFLSAANAIGVPIVSFVTLLGLIGLAVSLALQGVLSNLAGGFILLASHPFNVGDYIEHNSLSGTVKEIRMLHTRLETPDGKMVYIPNSSLSGDRLINYTETGRRRVELTVSASYDNSPEQVRGAIEDAIRHTDGILSDPAPVIAVDNYGDSAISYSIWAYVKGSDFIAVKQKLNERLFTSFAENGVEMTYPHINVHMNESRHSS